MVGIIIQARMNSSRFPNKAMEKIGGVPILEIIIGKLSRFENVVLLTRTTRDCDCLCEIAEKHGLKVHRQDDDLLKGFFECSFRFGFKDIVRITGDCPLVDPQMVDFMVKLHSEGGADYTSNCHPKRLVPKGFDVEVFKYNALAWAEYFIADPYCREHVCPSFYNNMDIFTVKQPDENYSVDTPEDLERIRKLI